MNFTLKKSNLNFKVYTVESKPTTPGAENDIAIISSVPMTNWIMSPDNPTGIPRNEGDVWIQYSVCGNTKNILKQNAMTIATIRAWQYVDGAWVDREAVSCQDGAWVDWWDGSLYINGNEYAHVTGGWGTDGYTISDGSITSVSAGVKNSDHFFLQGSYSTKVMLGTLEPINADKFTTLHVDAEVTGITNDASITFCVSRTKAASSLIKKSDFGSEKQRKVLNMDLSDISGDIYIQVHAQYAPACSGKVYRVWLE